MFLPLGYPINKFYEILANSANTISLTAADKVVLPGLKTPPNGINPAAQKKYWAEFVTKYSSTWQRYKNEPDRAWACCVAIWTNYCLKRKTQPFDASATQVNEDNRETLIRRTVSARKSQLKLAESLLTRGIQKGLISRFLKETFVSASENKPGVYTMLSRRIIKLEKGVDFDSQEFRDFMTKKSFKRRLGIYTRNTKTNTDVIVCIDQDLQQPVIVFKNVLTKAYAEIMLEIPPAKGNNEEVKNDLIKAWKYLISHVIEAD